MPMTSLYFPAKVALVLRRVVNLVSGLSVSTQYLTQRQTELAPGPLEAQQRKSSSDHTAFDHKQRPSYATKDGVLLAVSSITWPWRWPAFLLNSGITHTPTSRPTPPSTPLSDPYHSNKPQHNVHDPDPNSTSTPKDIIHRLMQNSALYDPLRKPRYPIVLCHGLYGFDVIGPSSFPSLQRHYWSTVLSILREKLGAEVIVTSVPGTASIATRADIMNRQLKNKANGRGVNFLAHSMGGLDCRHLISHIKPTEYMPLSLTTVCTPHRGSPFMDWCANNIGIGKIREREELLSRSSNIKLEDVPVEDIVPSTTTTGDKPNAESKSPTFSLSLSSLPSSFTTLLLSIVDSPAYNNLTSTYLETIFNPNTPDDPSVKYFSVAGRMPSVNIWHPFWLPKTVLDGVEERERGELKKNGDADSHRQASPPPLWAREHEWGNDGLVTIQSAKWGQFLGIIDGADHWEMRGARGIMIGVENLPLIGGSSESGDGWGFKDWARFVGAWKKEEKRERDAAAAATRGDPDTENIPEPTTADENAKRETLIKTSTDTLSSVFDYLTEHIPGTSGLVIGMNTSEPRGDAQQNYPEMKKHMDKVGSTVTRKKNELGTMQDIEKFYLALSRKLYDEGL